MGAILFGDALQAQALAGARGGEEDTRAEKGSQRRLFALAIAPFNSSDRLSHPQNIGTSALYSASVHHVRGPMMLHPTLS